MFKLRTCSMLMIQPLEFNSYLTTLCRIQGYQMQPVPTWKKGIFLWTTRSWNEGGEGQGNKGKAEGEGKGKKRGWKQVAKLLVLSTKLFSAPFYSFMGKWMELIFSSNYLSMNIRHFKLCYSIFRVHPCIYFCVQVYDCNKVTD